MGEVDGWERPNWYAPPGMEPEYEYSYGRQNWFDPTAAECRAVRDAVAPVRSVVLRQVPGRGPGRLQVLNRISAQRCRRAGRAGSSTPNGCNERGGIEADLTVTRLAETRFLVVTGAAAQTRDMAWLRRHIPDEARCSVADITSGLPMIALMGPQLARVAGEAVGRGPVQRRLPVRHLAGDRDRLCAGRASRITYVGELGWELYVPAEFAAHVFDRIVEAGAAFGLRPPASTR